MTATINPGKTLNVAISSTTERIQQYENALNYYIKSKIFEKIIFAENSGADLKIFEHQKNLAESKSISIEFIDSCGNNSHQMSKGIGEALIIKNAFNRSKIITEKNKIITKISGRYIVKNTIKIVEDIEGYDIITDLRGNLSTSDSRIFSFTPYFFEKYFDKYINFINDNKNFYFEHALALAAHACIADGGRWKLAPRTPIIDGYNGTTGEKIKTSLSKRIRHIVKAAMIKY